jgi:hypothetical protein
MPGSVVAAVVPDDPADVPDDPADVPDVPADVPADVPPELPPEGPAVVPAGDPVLGTPSELHFCFAFTPVHVHAQEPPPELKLAPPPQ